jgi:protein-L-isoaspartate(D-aspartate) O-methyltransferase
MSEIRDAEGSAMMLRDIEAEVEATRREIGKDALDAAVMTAMASVPRQHFVPEPFRGYAYSDGPLPIGHGQTISQPYIVALMTDLVRPRPDSIILEVGTGSGYQAAVLAKLVRHVYTIEIVPALADAAEEHLRRLGFDTVTVRQGDGWHGWPEHAPFDGIVVTAAAAEVPPPLLAQLKPGARLVIPVGPPGGIQDLMVVEKADDGSVSERCVLSVAFVPLTRSPPG